MELLLHHVTGFCVGGDDVENGFNVVVLHRVGLAVDVVVVAKSINITREKAFIQLTCFIFNSVQKQ